MNGSTYHSILGINPRGKDEDGATRRSEATSVNDSAARLRVVRYIFIDEVSMIACHELYAISARLSAISDIHDLPFGGFNIILAGDFAQLPPTSGKALYYHPLSIEESVPTTLFAQQTVIGKLTWHQFTTVVILKKNMRQKKPGGPDAALRTALENMRYGACTAADIQFLNSRISRRLTDTDLSLPQFKNVSIITCYNSYKDRYNDLGTVRFAHDTNQNLVNFYSVDTLGGVEDPSDIGRKRKKRISKQTMLSQSLQNLIWNSEPHTSEHIPGKLSLCLGLPVMLRYNDATELCMTKGQEGVVVGWDSKPGNYETMALETVYVRLVNPPQEVKIPGLPNNTVPITKTKHKIRCHLPDDTVLSIEREQVNLLPNFSMTDYASQGKTRAYNVVDLSRCRTVQSIYTCLSRSSSAAGTIIAHPFNALKLAHLYLAI